MFHSVSLKCDGNLSYLRMIIKDNISQYNLQFISDIIKYYNKILSSMIQEK